jgi:hypothetical protein
MIGIPTIVAGLRKLRRSLKAGDQARAAARAKQAESGQATSESAVLLTSVLLATAGTGGWIMNAHPDWLNGLNIHVHSFYYLLSLPFP